MGPTHFILLPKDAKKELRKAAFFLISTFALGYVKQFFFVERSETIVTT